VFSFQGTCAPRASESSVAPPRRSARPWETEG
jgi:hypothetical protein